MKLVKDRRRLEQLVTGAGAGGNGSRPAARARDVEMEEVMEELHEKVRGLQLENERLKQRLLVAKQQVQGQSRKPSPYGRSLPLSLLPLEPCAVRLPGLPPPRRGRVSYPDICKAHRTREACQPPCWLRRNMTAEGRCVRYTPLDHCCPNGTGWPPHLTQPTDIGALSVCVFLHGCV